MDGDMDSTHELCVRDFNFYDFVRTVVQLCSSIEATL